MSNSTAQVKQRLKNVGIVVIGRNEGKRLERCLNSLVSQTTIPLVYVDSGSADGSVQFAQSLGVFVENLDTSIPFTMGRARNVGFRYLMKQHPELRYVQFVDGDCEVDEHWIKHGADFLDQSTDVVAVCGYLKERFPQTSIYNHLAELEWQGPVGAINSCGGNAMYNVATFKAAGGFDEKMIAGEEPELCVRLRREGGLIWRLGEPMALHDADLTRFSQWWRRVMRSGYAYAEGVAMHGSSPQRHFVKQLARALFYGLMVPCGWSGGVTFSFLIPQLSILAVVATLLAVGLYTKSFISAFRSRLQLGNARSEAMLYAAFAVLGKFPETIGALKYFIDRALGRRSGLIEYKKPSR